MATIKNISVRNWFGFNISDDFFSFWLAGMPTDIHFTIAYNSNSPDINFHITKNIDGTDKPKIEIVRIKKELAGEMLPHFSKLLLFSAIKPLDIEQIKKQCKNKARFVSNNKLERSKAQEIIGEQMENRLTEIAKISHKGKRIKTDGKEVQKVLEGILLSKNAIRHLKKLEIDIPERFDDFVDGGMLRYQNTAICVIVIHGKWFQLNEINIEKIIGDILSEGLGKKIFWYARKSFVRMRKAKSPAEVLPFNKPIVLIKKDKV